MLTCTHCKVDYPPTLEFFGPNQKKLNGLSSWCRSCMRDRARRVQTWRRKHDRVKLLAEKQRHLQSPQGREWKRLASLVDNHRRRAKHLPFQWSLASWKACLTWWKNRCAYCGKRRRRIEHDHVIPLSNPTCPGTVPWNIVPACITCNRKKHVCVVVTAEIRAYFRHVRKEQRVA